MIVWTVEDIQERAKENGQKISKAVARKVLQSIKKNHDCNVGINWEVIDYHLDNL